MNRPVGRLYEGYKEVRAIRTSSTMPFAVPFRSVVSASLRICRAQSVSSPAMTPLTSPGK